MQPGERAGGCRSGRGSELQAMVEAMRKSGKDFKGNPVPPEYSKNYGYTVVCVTEAIQPRAIGASVKYCVTIP